MKKALLKVMGVVFAIGCASAGAVDTTGHPGTVAPTIRQQTLVASAAGYISQGTSAGLAHAGNLVLPSATSVAASSLKAPQIGLSPVRGVGGPSLRKPGTAARHQGGGYLVPVEAVPEPSGGAMLLCGLAVLMFIARRKTQPVEA